MTIPYQITLQLINWRVKKFAHNLIPCKKVRKRLQKSLPRKWDIVSYSDKNMRLYQEALESYPEVLTAEQTFADIVQNRSFSRIGDGEFNVMVGDRNSFNNSDNKLAQRLIEICEAGSTSNCLVCLNNYKLPKSHPAYNWFVYHGTQRLQKILDCTKFRPESYGDAYFLIRCSQQKGAVLDKGLEKIKGLWKDKKVLFVCNEKSAVIEDKLNVFSDVAQKEFLFIPSRNAFSSYETILADIKKYGTDWKIYMEAGATASVLAWDLAQCGYHALDMGDFYNRCAELLLKKEAAVFIC